MNVKRIKQGVLGGMAGGAVFGMIMAMMGGSTDEPLLAPVDSAHETMED